MLYVTLVETDFWIKNVLIKKKKYVLLGKVHFAA